MQERADYIAEWLRLTGEVISAQVEPKMARGRPPSGVNAASRELGIKRAEAQRAGKIASIRPEARAAAKAAGLDDNQSVLLKVASEKTAEKQLARIRAEQEKADGHKANRETDRVIALTEAQQFAAMKSRASAHMRWFVTMRCVGPYRRLTRWMK